MNITQTCLARICLVLTILLCQSHALAQANKLIEIKEFGDNPSNLKMHLYIPEIIAKSISTQNKRAHNDALPNVPLLLAVHYCHGDGPEFFRGSRYGAMADEYGYMIIFPSANSEDMCFDVASPKALRRNGGSDPVSIMSMVKFTQNHYPIDTDRIFVTGVSSGAMMTNVLIGLYPDVFKAGVAFAGVPFGCFATQDGSTWNSRCAEGKISYTAKEWGDRVRSAYPTYKGKRPRLQIWHGTKDEILSYHNFEEAIKQWTNVFRISNKPTEIINKTSDITLYRYGGVGLHAPFEALSMKNEPHNLPVDYAAAIHYFGLDRVSDSNKPENNKTTIKSDSKTPAPSSGSI